MTNRRNSSTDDGPEEVEDKEDLVDEWGVESFPASDPPGRVPPSLDSEPKSSESTKEPEDKSGDGDEDP